LRGSDSSGPGGLRASLRALERMDAVVALTEYGAGRLADAGVAREKIEVIPHGAFDYLTDLPERPLPPELQGASGPVILLFGLIRPYKGADVLLRAFSEMEAENAEVWIAGRPLGVDMEALRRQAQAAGRPVRIIDRFVSDSEVPAVMRRADVVALPYREVEQSGVLYTALAFGKAIVASSVGGFPEVAAAGEGGTLRLVPPGDHVALAEALDAVVGEPAERARLEAAASAAAAGPYAWDTIAAQTLSLYERVVNQR
jgi:glycosyltransferase involved in cell wall biosynthesis